MRILTFQPKQDNTSNKPIFIRLSEMKVGFRDGCHFARPSQVLWTIRKFRESLFVAKEENLRK